VSFITCAVKKVSDIVQAITSASETELTALSKGVLNLSAFAKRIHPEVERRALKPVRVGTIVVALSRFAKSLAGEDPLLPNVELDSIAVKSALAELAFDKTLENKARAANLYKQKNFTQADFLTITHGVGEISIFAPETLIPDVLKAFAPARPKLLLENLVALTVRFGEKYIEIPNMYFAIMRELAVKKINFAEIISTFTELTFLVDQEDLTEVFTLLNSLMRSRKQRTRAPHSE